MSLDLFFTMSIVLFFMFKENLLVKKQNKKKTLSIYLVRHNNYIQLLVCVIYKNTATLQECAEVTFLGLGKVKGDQFNI